MAKLPGGWEIVTDLKLDNSRGFMVPCDPVINHAGGFAGVMVDALSENDCDSLIKLFEDSHIAAPVSIQGRQDYPDDRVGSVRATGWSQHLANELWSKMQHMIPDRKKTNEFAATDWWQGTPREEWVPVGISPMLRFMKYEQGGQHYAHYDAGFIYPDDKYRTLQSFVLYLTTNTNGGATRFIRDNQTNIPTPKRDLNDWVREVEDNEVIAAVYPKKGNILFFDHRLCHDVQKYSGDTPRIIVRGDIIYEGLN